MSMPWIMAGALACGGRAAPRTPVPSATDWKSARASLLEKQGEGRVGAYSEVVRVKLRDPISGKRFQAEGAIAVDPGRAFRMMLVGPGGVTAVDAWGTPSAFVFSVPQLPLLRSGGSESPPGLPIGFFRWWFLSRWSGTLLWAAEGASESQWILKNDGAVVVVANTSGRLLRAERRSGGGAERIEWSSASARDAAGDRGRYVDEGSGLEVDIEVLSMSAEAPDPEAFVDPRVLARRP